MRDMPCHHHRTPGPSLDLEILKGNCPPPLSSNRMLQKSQVFQPQDPTLILATQFYHSTILSHLFYPDGSR